MRVAKVLDERDNEDDASENWTRIYDFLGMATAKAIVKKSRCLILRVSAWRWSSDRIRWISANTQKKPHQTEQLNKRNCWGRAFFLFLLLLLLFISFLKFDVFEWFYAASLFIHFTDIHALLLVMSLFFVAASSSIFGVFLIRKCYG